MAEFHDKAGQPQTFDADSARDFMAGMIEGGQIVLVNRGGFICGFVTPSPVNSKWFLALELFWWSDGGGGVALMDGFTKVAIERGANEIRFSCRASTPKIERYLKRVGYSHDEQVYKKVI